MVKYTVHNMWGREVYSFIVQSTQLDKRKVGKILLSIQIKKTPLDNVEINNYPVNANKLDKRRHVVPALYR